MVFFILIGLVFLSIPIIRELKTDKEMKYIIFVVILGFVSIGSYMMENFYESLSVESEITNEIKKIPLVNIDDRELYMKTNKSLFEIEYIFKPKDEFVTNSKITENDGLLSIITIDDKKQDDFEVKKANGKPQLTVYSEVTTYTKVAEKPRYWYKLVNNKIKVGHEIRVHKKIIAYIE